MKRSFLFFAVALPFTAFATAETGNQKLNYEELRDDVQATDLLGAEVRSEQDQEVGSVEDVILDRDGKIVSVIVQLEGDIEGSLEQAGESTENAAQETGAAVEGAWDETRRTAERTWDDATSDRDRGNDDNLADTDVDGEVDYAAGEAESGPDGMGLDPDRAGSTEMGDDFVKVDWSRISFDRESETVRLSGSTADMEAVAYDQTAPSESQDEIRASNLVGMEVNLSDEESFGEVEDVLIDMQNGEASAIVVDSMEFFDKERYALPVDLSSINLEEEEITLQFTEQQIDDMEEFELDELDEAESASERM